MAVPPLIVQKNQNATSSAGPASLTTTWPSNTTAGTTLVAIMAGAMSAGGGAIGMPAGFTAVFTSFQAAIFIGVYIWPNNPGALGNVFANAFTNVNALASCIFEISGLGNTVSTVQDPQGIGSVVNNTAGTAIGGAATTKTPTIGNEVWLGAVMWLTGGGALTGSNLPTAGPGAWTASTLQTSTNGTTNLSLQGYSTVTGPTFPIGGQMAILGTIGSSASNAAVIVPLQSLISQALTNVLDAGTQGYVVGGQYQGAIGG